jgi:succinate dehydrogenase / fumarate reductase flavoprotein subunit
MTNIPGLYVIGEANFSDHGANRLGASALMQGLADGYFILPVTIGNYLANEIKTPPIPNDLPEFLQAEKEVKDQIERLVSIQGKLTVDEIWRELGNVMWEYAGMARNAEGLKMGIEKVKAIREEFWRNVKVPGSTHYYNEELMKACHVADFLELGELIMLDALHRNESCGGHFREEYQTEDGEALRDDVNYAHVAIWEYKGEGQNPERHIEPLKFEFVQPKQRSYK